MCVSVCAFLFMFFFCVCERERQRWREHGEREKGGLPVSKEQREEGRDCERMM